MSKFIFSLSLFLFFLQPVFPQGKIYTSEEANSLYGEVLQSVQITSSNLLQYSNETAGKIMFNIVDGKLIILDNQRIQLFPGNAAVLPADVFRVFSVQLVQLLINEGESPETSVELRADGIISLTNGNYTLEYGGVCPPLCK